MLCTDQHPEEENRCHCTKKVCAKAKTGQRAVQELHAPGTKWHQCSLGSQHDGLWNDLKTLHVGAGCSRVSVFPIQ